MICLVDIESEALHSSEEQSCLGCELDSRPPSD